MVADKCSPSLRWRPSTLRHVLATGVWPTSIPSLSSSAWILGAPQSGLARLISRIKRRISSGTLFWRWKSRSRAGRPNSRNPARCQRMIVFGLTIVKASTIRDAIRERVAKTKRSKLKNATRFGDFRCSTLSCRRSVRISASREARDRNSPITVHQISLRTSAMTPNIAQFGPWRWSD